MPAELYVGLMSGTSLDGVDAVLVGLGGSSPGLLATHYLPYPPQLRAEALAIQAPGENELHRAALLGNRLADLYAQTVIDLLEEAGASPAAIRAIGCHGQTIRHAPAEGYSIQIVNAARLAEKTGISVISDFRNRDIVAGGQGAPLVPAFHEACFRSPTIHRAILNIGGIANLTDLSPGKPTRGFDTGPGNMLLDLWAARHLGTPLDTGGQWAAQGKPIGDLLARLRAHPFFSLMPPKSCGREEFNAVWLDACLCGSEAPADVQSTLVELTASSITDALRQECGCPGEVYVCGGGTHNRNLMSALARFLPGCRWQTTDALGLSPDWVEAVAFAWLASRTLAGLPGNIPAVTGACGPRILGTITRA